MKKLFLLTALISIASYAQTNTEVFLFDLEKKEDGYSLTNKQNISNNKGYDSQPHFYDNNTILFSSTRNGQTDILMYDIKTGKKVFINDTPNGGEYSPQRIPGSDDVSRFAAYVDRLQAFEGFSGGTAVAELLGNADFFDLVSLSEGLGGKRVMLLAAEDDDLLRNANNAQLAEVYGANLDIDLTYKVLPGDPNFSWSRILLMRTVVDWMEGCR